MQTHVHPHSHCGRTLSIGEPSRKYSNARTRSDTEKVWKWEQKKLRSVGERVKWNDRDVGGEPRVWQWSWSRSPTHVLTPSKPPVHPSATTCIYVLLEYEKKKISSIWIIFDILQNIYIWIIYLYTCIYLKQYILKFMFSVINYFHYEASVWAFLRVQLNHITT